MQRIMVTDRWTVVARPSKKGWEAGDDHYLFESKTLDDLREELGIKLRLINRLRKSYDLPELWALW